MSVSDIKYAYTLGGVGISFNFWGGDSLWPVFDIFPA